MNFPGLMARISLVRLALRQRPTFHYDHASFAAHWPGIALVGMQAQIVGLIAVVQHIFDQQPQFGVSDEHQWLAPVFDATDEGVDMACVPLRGMNQKIVASVSIGGVGMIAALALV